MKTKDKNIENEVIKTMSSLDQLERARPKPFLYTRTMARMQAINEDALKRYELKPVYLRIAITGLSALVVFNLFTATLFLGNSSNTSLEITQEEIYFEQYYPSLTTIDNLEQNLTE